jgi:hypothetical protein
MLRTTDSTLVILFIVYIILFGCKDTEISDTTTHNRESKQGRREQNQNITFSKKA